MTTAYDDRLLNVQLTIDGQTISYDQRYAILATGTRYSGGNFGECSFKLDNISKTDRDFIISKTTLWSEKRSSVQVSINVGRASYGTFELFNGTLISASISQPPDIGLTLSCATGAARLGYPVNSSSPGTTTFQALCQLVANNLTAAQPDSPVILDFQSSQGGKFVNNYNFTGPVTNQITKLSEIASVRVWQENNKLKVRDIGVPDKVPSLLINSQTGLVEVPQITEIGVRVKMLMRNDITLYTPVILQSKNNALANGNFYVYKSKFEVASRDNPFYWVLDLTPPSGTLGVQQ